MTTSPKLVDAYKNMLERLQERFAALGEKEQEALHRLQNSLDHVVEEAVELDELTREEAHLIAAYLKRDLHDAAHHLAETGEELGAWLRFDTQLLEQRMLDWFGQAADKTRLELLQWENAVERATHYYSGEVTGPGSLQCEQCGHELQCHEPVLIPVCPHCGGECYVRLGNAAQ